MAVLFMHSLTEIIACDIILEVYGISDFSFMEDHYCAAEATLLQKMLLDLKNIYILFLNFSEAHWKTA